MFKFAKIFLAKTLKVLPCQNFALYAMEQIYRCYSVTLIWGCGCCWAVEVLHIIYLYSYMSNYSSGQYYNTNKMTEYWYKSLL